MIWFLSKVFFCFMNIKVLQFYLPYVYTVLYLPVLPHI